VAKSPRTQSWNDGGWSVLLFAISVGRLTLRRMSHNAITKPTTSDLHPGVYAALIGLSLWSVAWVWSFFGAGVTPLLLFIVSGAWIYCRSCSDHSLYLSSYSCVQTLLCARGQKVSYVNAGVVRGVQGVPSIVVAD
jgi:hypothetical protein